MKQFDGLWLERGSGLIAMFLTGVMLIAIGCTSNTSQLKSTPHPGALEPSGKPTDSYPAPEKPEQRAEQVQLAGLPSDPKLEDRIPFTFPDGIPGIALVVRKGVLLGIVVERNGNLITMRSPDPSAEGMVGPDGALTLFVKDLDHDGTVEFVIKGLSSPHTWAVWVYRFDSVANVFNFLDFVPGDRGIVIDSGSDGKTVFSVYRQDWEHQTWAHRPVIQTTWVWSGDRFRQVNIDQP